MTGDFGEGEIITEGGLADAFDAGGESDGFDFEAVEGMIANDEGFFAVNFFGDDDVGFAPEVAMEGAVEKFEAGFVDVFAGDEDVGIKGGGVGVQDGFRDDDFCEGVINESVFFDGMKSGVELDGGELIVAKSTFGDVSEGGGENEGGEVVKGKGGGENGLDGVGEEDVGEVEAVESVGIDGVNGFAVNGGGNDEVGLGA